MVHAGSNGDSAADAADDCRFTLVELGGVDNVSVFAGLAGDDTGRSPVLDAGRADGREFDAGTRFGTLGAANIGESTGFDFKALELLPDEVPGRLGGLNSPGSLSELGEDSMDALGFREPDTVAGLSAIAGSTPKSVPPVDGSMLAGGGSSSFRLFPASAETNNNHAI